MGHCLSSVARLSTRDTPQLLQVHSGSPGACPLDPASAWESLMTPGQADEHLLGGVGELTALGEVGRALSSTLDLETVRRGDRGVLAASEPGPARSLHRAGARCPPSEGRGRGRTRCSDTRARAVRGYLRMPPLTRAASGTRFDRS